MPYYPFIARTSQQSLPRLLPAVLQLGAGFASQITLETAQPPRQVFEQASHALEVFQASPQDCSGLDLNGEYHQLSLKSLGKNHVIGEVWDFSNAQYESGQLTPELRDEKQRLVLNLFKALLGAGKSRSVLISGRDSKYEGEPGFDGLAERFEQLLAVPSPAGLDRLLPHSHLFWLIGLSKTLEEAQTSTLKPLLDTFQLTAEGPDYRIYENRHAAFRPYFLQEEA